jgi:hypothetical protein
MSESKSWQLSAFCFARERELTFLNIRLKTMSRKKDNVTAKEDGSWKVQLELWPEVFIHFFSPLERAFGSIRVLPLLSWQSTPYIHKTSRTWPDFAKVMALRLLMKMDPRLQDSTAEVSATKSIWRATWSMIVPS